MEIRSLRSASEAEAGAAMMANSEPWLTLGRGHDVLLRMLTDPTREVYVAEVDGVLAGLIVLNMRGAFVGYIQTICVEPGWRNRGIGSQLLAFAEQRIFRDAPNVFICVSSFNADARRLYERLGYTLIGELKDYLVAGYSETLLRKTIGPLSEFKKSEPPPSPSTWKVLR